ncbi:MAG: NUMOD4 domain-containing protein [Methanoregula sp.]
MSEWRMVPSWPNYEANEDGSVRQISSGRILKTYESEGYLIVKVTRPGLSRTIRVQYLVAEAFLGPKPPGHNLHHKDELKFNNVKTNLEYLPEPNHRSIHQSGMNNNSAKLTEDEVIAIRHLCSAGKSLNYVARMFGVGKSTVKDIIKGNTWVNVQAGY